MKLMCVNNLSLEEGYIPPLTPGKIYESDDYFLNTHTEVLEYKILNDAGFYSWELNDNFIPLEKWREQQLSKLI